jgi:hypothetical protein
VVFVASLSSIRPYQQIQEHLNIINLSSKTEEATSSLIALGIHPSDKEAAAVMSGKIIETLSSDSQIIPSPRDPGVYYVYNLSGYQKEEKAQVITEIVETLSCRSRTPGAESRELEPTAIFKIGSKRAQVETTVRKIAHLLGFQAQSLPGVFFTIRTAVKQKTPFESMNDIFSSLVQKNALLEKEKGARASASFDERANPSEASSEWSEDEEVFDDFHPIEELWSGQTKVYQGLEEKSSHLVGILEPFNQMPSMSKQKKKQSYAFLTLFSLAIGLRDAREDNITNVILDSEECMPNRIEPNSDVEEIDHQVAATHLPFLNSEFLDQPMNKQDFAHCARLIRGWDIEKIVTEVSEEKIKYADLVSEKASLVKSKHKLQDSNKNEVRVIVDQNPDHEDDLFDPKNLEKTNNVFDEKQIVAFKTRLERLKKLFSEDAKETLTPREMVAAVDPFYVKHIKMLELLESKRRERTLSIDSAQSGRFSASLRSLSSEYERREDSPKRFTAGRFSPFEVAGRYPGPSNLARCTTRELLSIVDGKADLDEEHPSN